jgi:hypothetical protein
MAIRWRTSDGEQHPCHISYPQGKNFDHPVFHRFSMRLPAASVLARTISHPRIIELRGGRCCMWVRDSRDKPIAWADQISIRNGCWSHSIAQDSRSNLLTRIHLDLPLSRANRPSLIRRLPQKLRCRCGFASDRPFRRLFSGSSKRERGRLTVAVI